MSEDFFGTFKTYYEKSNKRFYRQPINKEIQQRLVSGDIGIEIELEGNNVAYPGGYFETIVGKTSKASWKRVQEGSLRNGGTEYVLDTPCFIQEVPFLVTGLYNKLVELGARVDNSNRCSTHVHINMQGKKINELTSVIVLWYSLENLIIPWGGIERVNNHFCLPLEQTSSTLDQWHRYLKKEGWAGDNNLKYSALNLLPFIEKGSFEFRCGPAADTADKVIDWVTFIYYLCEYAKIRYKDPRFISNDISEQGPLEIVKDICNTFSLPDHIYTEIENAGGSTSIKPYRDTQKLLYDIPWDIWLKEIDKPYVPSPFKAAQLPEDPW